MIENEEYKDGNRMLSKVGSRLSTQGMDPEEDPSQVVLMSDVTQSHDPTSTSHNQHRLE